MVVMLSKKILLCTLAILGANSIELPTVDLGYEIHQASFYNESGNFYNFSNIRYAAPPLYDNRFRVPQKPATNRATVKTGSKGRICPQVNPSWLEFDFDWIGNSLTGKPLNVTQKQLKTINGSISTPAQIPPMDPRTTEDCLFLDVVVPKDVFSKKHYGRGAPVLVWFYGGGYASGDKTSSGNPAGLIKRSQDLNRPGIIYVAPNYRLGAFGWLAGSKIESDGVANAGLYDQRFALEWVQKYISKFGGDPARVTVIGESAGGGSIMHQITAYGGKHNPPFKQAILQSPAFVPLTSNYVNELNFGNFLSLANLTSLKEARAADSKTLIAANFLQIFRSNYGSFTFGPTVDGTFVPELPGLLLRQGYFSKDVKVMVGHNSDEGLLFTNPFVKTENDFADFVEQTFPDASPKVRDHILHNLYPPVYNGSYNYTSPIGRSALLIAEFSIACNTYFLDRAFHNHTFAYLFNVYPGLHAQDIGFTYYNGGAPTPSLPGFPYNITVALALQDYITTFTETGIPTSPDVKGIPKFTVYGAEARVQDLELSTITTATDPAANRRCDWWQKALYRKKR